MGEGVFLDKIKLLSDNNTVVSVHLNNTLRSACKLTSPEIQTEILDSALQVFRKQGIIETIQADYLAVIAD